VGLLLLFGAAIGFIQYALNFIKPLIRWFPPLTKSEAEWQALVGFGLLIGVGYVVGHLIERAHIVKSLLMKISFIRNFYYGKMRGGKPALISPNEKVWIGAVYIGHQTIEILGQKPKKIQSSRMGISSFPIPVTGYAEYISEDLVYIVTNIPLTDWLANYFTALGREFLPAIKAIPYSEYKQNLGHNQNH